MCRKRFILPDDLFLKEEKNLIKHRTLFLFLSHTSSNQTSARKARKKKDRACFASSVLSPPPIKKTSPIRVKSPTTPGDKERGHDDNRRRRRRQQQQTTRFGERSGGTFGRRRRRRRRQRGNKNESFTRERRCAETDHAASVRGNQTVRDATRTGRSGGRFTGIVENARFIHG